LEGVVAQVAGEVVQGVAAAQRIGVGSGEGDVGGEDGLGVGAPGGVGR